MPTYQYVCTDCGSDLEAVQSISEPSLSDCPTCGGKLRKKFSAVGVVFKGSGFYRNDSRSEAKGGAGESKPDSSEKSETKAEKSEKAETADSSTKAETKAEPAAKSESKPKPDAGSGPSSSKGSSGSSGSAGSSGSSSSSGSKESSAA